VTKRIEVINWSEFSTLANCETQWGYAYLLGAVEPGDKLPLHKGTLLHLGLDRWTLGLGATLPEVWTDDINTGGKPGEVRTLHLSDFDPQLVEDVRWLLARYELVYGSQPPSSWNVISTEEWLTGTIKVGARKVRIVGRHDGLIEIPELDQLWLIERKSYGQRGRLDTVQAELQSVIYDYLIQTKYKRKLTGILYDGIYTHRFVPKVPTQKFLIEAELARRPNNGFELLSKARQTEWAREQVALHPGVERDAADSFERQWIDHTQQQIDMSHVVLGATIKRRGVLKTLDDTIPHVGRQCSWCGFKDRCWARLTGVNQDIELVGGYFDEGDEPV
jgi:hypothetical protein